EVIATEEDLSQSIDMDTMEPPTGDSNRDSTGLRGREVPIYVVSEGQRATEVTAPAVYLARVAQAQGMVCSGGNSDLVEEAFDLIEEDVPCIRAEVAKTQLTELVVTSGINQA